MTNPEPQEELQEVLNEQTTQESNELSEESVEVSPTEEEGQASTEEQAQEEIDPKDPRVVHGKELMKEQMQDAFNKRINKAYGKFREREENIINQFQKQIEELKSQVIPKKEPPKIEDYENAQDFVKESFEYYNGQKPQSQPQKQGEKQPSQLEYEFAAKAEEYAKAHPDYFAKASRLIPYTKDNPSLYEAIAISGPEVAEHLSDRLDIVDDLSNLSPIQMGRELSKLENELKRSKPLPKKANPKPRPTAEHRGSNASQTDIVNMSKQDFAKMMAEIRT